MENPFFIVGAVNVTVDSFHDGGQFSSTEAAVKRAGEMLREGADIIEIGGESTGPGSKDVSLEEERSKVIPVIRAIRKQFPKTKLSVDTWKTEVVLEAVKEDVVMINDVTAGRGSDGAMFEVLKDTDVSLVLMYSKDATPRTTIADVRYDDVIDTISAFLRQRKGAAIAAGIAPDRIILDPGLGHFVSSDAKYSFEIIARLGEFLTLGSPVFVSPSRKSFLAGWENLKTEDRLPGTIAASARAVQSGATYIRTHDVASVRRGCEIALKIRNRIKNQEL
ncbi:MAG: dihydropteroate synthase [Patescibacteria group bacterium]